jgi:L-lactate dehydrogenase (cytochrome)
VTQRQLPTFRELRPLLRSRPAELRPTKRLLANAVTISDLRLAARRRVPRAVFDYTDGAAEQEVSLRRSRRAFQTLELHPSVLHGVANLDTSTSVLGAHVALPFAFAPTGFTRLMNYQGESAVMRVAAKYHVPYALSTLGTTSIEDVAAAAPSGRKWFQLYVWKDRSAGEDLMARARDAGFEALILTVDAPVAGMRLRDVRNGFAIPPALTLKTVLDISRHPRWWTNLLTTAPLAFASLSDWNGTIAELMNELFDPTMTMSDLDWVRSRWHGPLIIKGIQTLDDALRMADAGVDAIVLSNHGGRQLDRTPAPIRLVPHVVDAIGSRVEVWVDGGIMSGADIVAAIALGARSVLIGRAYLYGLMAGGERGVVRAVEILSSEIRRTMELLGVRTIRELKSHHVTLS